MTSVHTDHGTGATADDKVSLERRRYRYELQRFLGATLPEDSPLLTGDIADTLTFTTLERVARCGRYRVNGGAPVGIGRTPSGRVTAQNVQRCGSVWACPVCQPKIRQERAVEIKAACDLHLDESVEKFRPAKFGKKGKQIWPEVRYRKGSLLFITLTMPHDDGDELDALWRAVAESWTGVWAGQAGMAMRRTFGIVGSIRALEVTHGTNGWHPHLHVMVFLDDELDDQALGRLTDSIYARWRDGILEHGYREPTRARGINVQRVVHADELAQYLVELVEGGWSPHMELARLDLKAGRNGGRAPLEILGGAYRHGDPLTVTPDGELANRDLVLWREFEKASHGRNQLTWTPGLKALLGVVDRTDEELVEDSTIAGTLIELTIDDWLSLCRHAFRKARLFERIETHGANAGIRLLWQWGYRPWLYDPADDGVTVPFPFAVV